MLLTERDTGRVVPLQADYPRIVPYDPDYGGHQIAVQPRQDLAPCTWYRVATTDRLRDADGHAVVAAAWVFRTDGCPPAPTVVAAVTDPGDSIAAGTQPAPVPVPTSATPRYTG